MATSEDIERLLDMAAQKQLKCPLCGNTGSEEDVVQNRNSTLYVVFVEWRSSPACFDITGGFDYGEGDWCDPPAEIVNATPNWFCCENFEGHEGGKAHWWQMPPKTRRNYVG